MIRDTKRLRGNHYDLLVIGGGINGAAIANLAARRGLSVVLFEKGDFAGGTSSKSTKLVHGGLRYLENFEFDLVRESLKERAIQLKSAPHLVKPLSFIIPVYKNDQRPLWMVRLGVALYDLLSGKYLIDRHKSLKTGDVVELIPGIKKEGLLGGVMYYDAQMDDARLCLENVLSAAEKGAHVANYVEVTSFLKHNGKVVGVRAQDMIDGHSIEVRARKTVCAGGSWTNALLTLDSPHAKARVRATKGIHVVYPGQLSEHALLIPTKRDNRVFFVIPWKGNSLIGTTDTDYFGSPDRVEATGEDINYIFKEAERIFPGIQFKRDDIITTFAGLRPLVSQEGKPSDVSRKHIFFTSYSGLLFVIGGKYTTYRKIAQECLQKALEKNIEFSDKKIPIYGGGKVEKRSDRVAQQFHLDPKIVDNLKNTYGTRYLDVLQLTDKNPGLKSPLCPGSDVIAAQVVYAVQVEMAQNVDDIVERRLSIGYTSANTPACREEIERLMAVFKKE